MRSRGPTKPTDKRGRNTWLAVTEGGTEILVHIETDKHTTVLRRFDIQPEDPTYRPQRQSWVDAEESDKETLKTIADETSNVLAAALKRLGAA